MTTENYKLLRIKQVLEIYPVSRTSWYRGMKSGKYPRPVSLGNQVVAWFEADIKELVASLEVKQ
jgi:predicted DNA-binding transcriptional regulator AlpA